MNGENKVFENDFFKPKGIAQRKAKQFSELQEECDKLNKKLSVFKEQFNLDGIRTDLEKQMLIVLSKCKLEIRENFLDRIFFTKREDVYFIYFYKSKIFAFTSFADDKFKIETQARQTIDLKTDFVPSNIGWERMGQLEKNLWVLFSSIAKKYFDIEVKSVMRWWTILVTDFDISPEINTAALIDYKNFLNSQLGII